MINYELVPRMIDISSVKTDSTAADIEKMAETAKHFNFICAFAMPCFTQMLVKKLEDCDSVMVGGVVGFPSGADTTRQKIATAKEMMSVGVNELDMVINVGALKSGMYDTVFEDIKAVVDTANGMPVKSIIEIAYLTDDEIKRAAEIAVRAGVTYVKTGTGWGPKPTTPETIKIIKSTIGNSALIKAAGGVRNLDTLEKMVENGCSRFGIGINSAVCIMKEVYQRLGKKWDYEG